MDRKQLFNQHDLSDRWRISARTLEKWRWNSTGPIYLKIGNRVYYRLQDIEAYELSCLRFPDDFVESNPSSEEIQHDNINRKHTQSHS